MTERELQVLALVAEGYSNQEIADRLGISVETVKTHLRKILAKMQAQNRAHAVGIGFRIGALA